MLLVPKPHLFSLKDTEAMIGLGYSLIKVGKMDFVNFINDNLPNFDILSLLRTVETNFSGTSNTTIHKTIEVSKAPNTLKINFENEFKNEDDALLFVREFLIDTSGIQINHLYCVLPKEQRGKGLIKPVFQESLQQYINMNAGKICVHAGLSGGGYTWAKHGFVAVDKNETEAILERSKKTLPSNEFAAVKRIFDKYYSDNPNGKSFPIDLWATMPFMKQVLLGSDWHGELDLKNEEQILNFTDYVFRKA